MKFAAAFVLVIISMVCAEIPRKRIEIVRKPAPYIASGWAPSGQQLNLPLKAQSPPVPAASYGPPPEAPQPETTTTEQPTTTETSTEQLASQQVKPDQPKSGKLQQETQQQGPFYVVLPQQQQQQQSFYAVQNNAALYAIPRNAATTSFVLAPVESVESNKKSGKLENESSQEQLYVVVPQEQNYYTNAALLSVSKPSFQVSSVYTPFSSSYVQIYQ